MAPGVGVCLSCSFQTDGREGENQDGKKGVYTANALHTAVQFRVYLEVVSNTKKVLFSLPFVSQMISILNNDVFLQAKTKVNNEKVSSYQHEIRESS